MKFVIQRVNKATVNVDNELIASINKGLLVFFCAEKGDENGGIFGGKSLDINGVIDYFANKILKLRIFEDENGKMNKSLIDIKGEILIVSQFTLAANCKKGTRPSFDSSMEPNLAKKVYEDFIKAIKKFVQTGEIKSLQTGIFGADMKISLINDGPVTIIM